MLLHCLSSFILLSIAAKGTVGIDPNNLTGVTEGGSADDGFSSLGIFSSHTTLSPSPSYTPMTVVSDATASYAHRETTISEPSSLVLTSTTQDGNTRETGTTTRPPDPTDGSGYSPATTDQHFTTSLSDNSTISMTMNDKTTLIPNTGPTINDMSSMTNGVTTLTTMVPTDVTMTTIDPTAANDTSFSPTPPALTVNDSATTDDITSMTMNDSATRIPTTGPTISDISSMTTTGVTMLTTTGQTDVTISMTTIDQTANDTSLSPTTPALTVNDSATTDDITSMTMNDSATLIPTTGPTISDISYMTTTGVTMLTTAGPTDVTISMTTIDQTANDTSFSPTTPALTVNDSATTDDITSMTMNDSATLIPTTGPTISDISAMTTTGVTMLTTTGPTDVTISMTTIDQTANDTSFSPTTPALTVNHSATTDYTTSMTTDDNATLIPTTGPTINETSSMTTTGLTTLMTTGSTNMTVSITSIETTTDNTSFSPTTPTPAVNDTTSTTAAETNHSATTAAWTNNPDSMTTVNQEDTATPWMTTATPADNYTTTTGIFNATTLTTILTTTIPPEISVSVSAATQLTTVSSGPPSLAPSTTEVTGQTGTTSHEATSHMTSTSPDTTIIETSPLPTQGPVLVCPAEPCPLESVCLNGTCQCLSGNFLVDGRCTRGQVFAGQLHLSSLDFNSDMLNRSSKAFQNTAGNIATALAGAFSDQPAYIRSDVVQLAPGSVIATVNNIFANMAASQESVEQTIKEAIASSSQGLLINATFNSTDLCGQAPLPCDAVTAVCTNANGLVICSCKQGYVSTVYSNTSCKACPSGQHAVDNICKTCAFGYGGLNCRDSSLLAVVVVSCVLGGILLIMISALLAYCCWRRCQGDPGRRSSPYPTGELAKPWPSDITPIPRATATSTWDTSSMEMTEGGSTRVLVDGKNHTNGVGFQLKQSRWKKSGSYDLNTDAMKTFKSKNPSRYSYLVEGHKNPYFLPGDNKKN
ncbi:mucin-2 [Nerophis ophidion]|uniref:mucin-2 n=1 Tax=Nerophis ophidion TaxID=159077 RepID=UPI002ADF594E|nr:mucin-2 [Nerophis ophidion]